MVHELGIDSASDMTMRRPTVVLLALALLGAACSSSQSPSGPSPSRSLDLSGTWKGDFAVQDITAQMMWTLTQTASAVSGPVLVKLPNGVVLLNGFLTGTLTGSSLAYTISVGPQGIPSQPACVGQLGGTMTATTAGTTSMLTGNYAVSSATCAPPFGSSGNISLTRAG
jgi:hypothetical protein